MDAFRRDYPAETTDMDASIEAASEFREFRERVACDDLPRFEADFKRYLNQNTIREIAGFQTRLTQQSKEITERIRAERRAAAANGEAPKPFPSSAPPGA